MEICALHHGHRAGSIVYHIVTHTPKDRPTQFTNKKNNFLKKKKNKELFIALHSYEYFWNKLLTNFIKKLQLTNGLRLIVIWGDRDIGLINCNFLQNSAKK